MTLPDHHKDCPWKEENLEALENSEMGLNLGGALQEDLALSGKQIAEFKYRVNKKLTNYR